MYQVGPSQGPNQGLNSWPLDHNSLSLCDSLDHKAISDFSFKFTEYKNLWI